MSATRSHVFDREPAADRWAIDVLLECYVSWREECQLVRVAYQRWAGSHRKAARLAYAGYLAAIDQEEQAARAYADQIERVRRISR